MIRYKTFGERQAALAAGEVLYNQLAAQHDLDAMQARAEEDAVAALRARSA